MPETAVVEYEDETTTRFESVRLLTSICKKHPDTYYNWEHLPIIGTIQVKKCRLLLENLTANITKAITRLWR